MTQQEIIELARQAWSDSGESWVAYGWFEDRAKALEAFAKLIAEKEREACANLCWKSEEDNAFVNSYNGKRIDLLCAELIRARGQA